MALRPPTALRSTASRPRIAGRGGASARHCVAAHLLNILIRGTGAEIGS